MSAPAGPALLRPATSQDQDIDAIFRVRTAVRENLLTEAELAERGVTRATVAAMLDSPDSAGWCAIDAGTVVGFSIARGLEGDLFALFVLPAFECRGIGSALLDRATEWLRARGAVAATLTTGRRTGAFHFYHRRGWREVGVVAGGEPRLELRFPSPAPGPPWTLRG